jgi:hypothetical protein
VTLIGKGKFNGCFIRGFQFDQDIQSGLESLHRLVEGQQDFIEGSWKQEPFATQSGLHGVHISYTFQGGMANHQYIVTNAQSRVGIEYYTAASWRNGKSIVPADASDEVQEMIRRTLRTE